MPALRELQTGFAAAMFDPEAAVRIAPGVQAQGIESARRLQVYRNNLFAGLTGVLAAVYPVTRRLVGEAWFDQAARGYIAVHPSRCGDVHRYGDGFAAYIGGCPGADALPYLTDTARLEWRYHCAFHAEQLPSLNIDSLRSLRQDDYPRLCLKLQPSARLLDSAYPVLRIWQVNQADWTGDPSDAAVVDLAEGGIRLLILREGLEVAFIPLGRGEHAWLQGLGRGMNLLESQQQAAALDPDFDLGAALRRHLLQGVFSGWRT